jgi:AcrR family transcriptional regulator
MTSERQTSSPRRNELLTAAYAYVQSTGLAEVSLRPLAAAIGSSPRVLLFLFGSKDGLIRAILERARRDEVEFIASLDPSSGGTLADVARQTWGWLSQPGNRAVLALWTEAYGRSLIAPRGPWGDFAAGTVRDWLDLLAAAQSPARRRTAAGAAERSMVLAVLRGGLLDLLATGDLTRTTAAVGLALGRLADPP